MKKAARRLALGAWGEIVESFDIERDADGNIIGDAAVRARTLEDGTFEVFETIRLSASAAAASVEAITPRTRTPAWRSPDES